MFQTAPISASSQSDVTEQMAARLKTALTTHLEQVYAPDQRKNLRLFSATETAELLSVSGQFLRKCHSDGTVALIEIEEQSAKHCVSTTQHVGVNW